MQQIFQQLYADLPSSDKKQKHPNRNIPKFIPLVQHCGKKTVLIFLVDQTHFLAQYEPDFSTNNSVDSFKLAKGPLSLNT